MITTGPTETVDTRRCFAVRGETCIDLIGENGLTVCYGRTLEEVRFEYPDAEEMSLDEFCQSKAAKQDTPWLWEDSTEAVYEDMLGVLPPAAMAFGAFLVGEPYDHHATTGQPRFSGFMRDGGGKFFETSRPIRFEEFKQWAEQTNRGQARYYYVS